MLKRILLVAAMSVCATAQAEPVAEMVPMLGVSITFDQVDVKNKKTPYWQAGLVQRHTESGNWRSLAGFSYSADTGLRSNLMGVDMAAWRTVVAGSNGLAASTIGLIVMGTGAVAITAAATNFDGKDQATTTCTNSGPQTATEEFRFSHSLEKRLACPK